MSQLKCLNPIILNEGREKSLQRHHPWIFSKAIAKVLGDYEKGDLTYLQRYDMANLKW